MYAFTYHQPTNVAGAVAATRAGRRQTARRRADAAAHDEAAARLARVARRSRQGRASSAGVSREGDADRHRRDDAATPMSRPAPIVRAGDPGARRRLPGMIGDPAVRNRGTIGGSLANNDPAADYPAAALGAGRDDRHQQARDRRRRFLQRPFRDGARSRARSSRKVDFPIPEKAAYEKFRNPASRYALVGVFVAKTDGGVRVAVTGAGSDGVFRAEQLEAALDANFSAAALEGHERAGATGSTRTSTPTPTIAPI